MSYFEIMIEEQDRDNDQYLNIDETINVIIGIANNLL